MSTGDGSPGASRGLILLLAAVSAIGPFAMQMFVPALPALQDDFGVSAAAAQLTFSVYIFSLAPALLVYGPLSDRYGRRPVLLGGVTLFVVGTLGCLLAPGLEWLVAGRALQSIGAGAGIVVTRALLSDLFGPSRMAAALSYTTMAMVVPPMIAPVVGGALADHADWRLIFAVLLAAGVLLLALVWFRLPEPEGHEDRRRLSVTDRYRAVLTTSRFYPYALQSTLTISMFYAFMAGAPYLMVDVLGRPATEYGLYFLLLAGGYMTGNFVSARLGGRVGIGGMILAGSVVAVLVAWLPVAFTALGWWTPIAFFLPMAVVTFSNGLSAPNAQTGAIVAVPVATGTASSVVGFLQQAIGAGVIQTVGAAQNGTPWPTVAPVLGCALLALGAALVIRARDRRAATVHPA